MPAAERGPSQGKGYTLQWRAIAEQSTMPHVWDISKEWCNRADAGKCPASAEGILHGACINSSLLGQ
ncbi:hypothetical protein COCOBI_17-2590 [Coccomyxa sp. Obi]|nr:hypothetical protein COCOBI_17-2590 [Coccomyxa sp. Obi]